MKNRPATASPFTTASLAAAEARIERGFAKFRAACAAEPTKTTWAKISAAKEVQNGLRKSIKLQRYMKINN